MADKETDKEIRAYVMDCLRQGAGEYPFDLEDESLFLEVTEEMEVQPILLQDLLDRQQDRRWPASIVKRLKRTNRSRFAGFELRAQEIERVLSLLQEIGVDCVLLKGIPFSCTIYRQPHHRTSSDTDILIDAACLPLVSEKMLEIGYEETPDLMFGTVSQQRQFCRRGPGGLEHVFEFHVALNNRHLLVPFGFEYFESRCDRANIGQLSFRIPKIPEAFVLASLHRAGHMDHDRRFLWLYDLMLLCKGMTASDWKIVIELVEAAACRAVVATEIQGLNLTVPGSIPKFVSTWAGVWHQDRSEASSYYLKPGRNRRADLLVGIRSLPSIGLRIKAVFLLVFPRPHYMRIQYDDGRGMSLLSLYWERWLKIMAIRE